MLDTRYQILDTRHKIFVEVGRGDWKDGWELMSNRKNGTLEEWNNGSTELEAVDILETLFAKICQICGKQKHTVGT